MNVYVFTCVSIIINESTFCGILFCLSVFYSSFRFLAGITRPEGKDNGIIKKVRVIFKPLEKCIDKIEKECICGYEVCHRSILPPQNKKK